MTVEECIKRITVETGEMLARAEGYDDLHHSWWSAPDGWNEEMVEKWTPLIRRAVQADDIRAAAPAFLYHTCPECDETHFWKGSQSLAAVECCDGYITDWNRLYAIEDPTP